MAGTTQNRQNFIRRARALAADFIKASDTFNALAAELNYTDLALPEEDGGLGTDDFAGANSDLSREQLLGFFSTMQALLEPLTVEQKKIIYATKGSSGAILPPGL